MLKTSIADTYKYVFDDSVEVMYDAGGIKVVVKGLSDKSFFGPGLLVYIENNSDDNITVQCTNTSVNGFMIDAIFSCDIVAGKRAVDEITFLNNDLEENGIKDIEALEISLHIFDTDSWSTITDTDTITLTF